MSRKDAVYRREIEISIKNPNNYKTLIAYDVRNAFKYKLDEQEQQKRNQIWNLTLNPKTFLRMDHSVTLYFVSSDFSFSHFLRRCQYFFFLIILCAFSLNPK